MTDFQTGSRAQCISRLLVQHSVYIGGLRNASVKQIDKWQGKVSSQVGTPRIFKNQQCLFNKVFQPITFFQLLRAQSQWSSLNNILAIQIIIVPLTWVSSFNWLRIKSEFSSLLKGYLVPEREIPIPKSHPSVAPWTLTKSGEIALLQSVACTMS